MGHPSREQEAQVISPNTRWNAPPRGPDTAARSTVGRRQRDPRRETRRDAPDYQEFDPFVEGDCVAGLALETGLALLRRGEDEND